jgi:four helix bundle protein
MVAHTYRELAAWQLAVALRDQTIAIIPTNPHFQDRKLFDQLRSSVDSAADNIAEGFGRFEPVDFARFLSIAIASLDEADNQFRKGVTCGALTADQAAPRLILAARCRAAALGLRRYLLGPGRDYVAKWKTRQRN